MKLNFFMLRFTILAVLWTVTLFAAAPTRGENAPQALPAPTFADVTYGPHERQRLDLWQAPGVSGPTPLLIAIPGGGWINCDKSGKIAGLKHFLTRGISVACISYRTTPDSPLPAPVMDAARALQFLRFKAKEWKLDTTRFSVMGDSAGGCSSLWIATHDDLADPQSQDPVLRESTRVCAAAVLNAQTTIEPNVIREWIGERGVAHGMIRSAAGFKSNQEMDQAIAAKPDIARLYREFSPVNHLTPDDPPIYLSYGCPLDDTKEGIHHALFGLNFKRRADAIGLQECIFEVRNDPKYAGIAGSWDAFLTKHLAPSITTVKEGVSAK